MVKQWEWLSLLDNFISLVTCAYWIDSSNSINTPFAKPNQSSLIKIYKYEFSDSTVTFWLEKNDWLSFWRRMSQNWPIYICRQGSTNRQLVHIESFGFDGFNWVRTVKVIFNYESHIDVNSWSITVAIGLWKVMWGYITFYPHAFEIVWTQISCWELYNRRKCENLSLHGLINSL